MFIQGRPISVQYNTYSKLFFNGALMKTTWLCRLQCYRVTNVHYLHPYNWNI